MTFLCGILHIPLVWRLTFHENIAVDVVSAWLFVFIWGVDEVFTHDKKKLHI